MPAPENDLVDLIAKYREIESEIRAKQSELSAARKQIESAARSLGLHDIIGSAPSRPQEGRGAARYVVVASKTKAPVKDAGNRGEIRFRNKMTVLRGKKYRHLADRSGQLSLLDEESGEIVVAELAVKD